MIIGAMTIKFYAPWVKSLKEKRMIVKSICGKAGSKFNISIAEVGEQDVLKTIVIGLACVTDETSHCNSILDNVLYFIEENTEAEIVKIDREIM